jgi:phospholipid-transporting ATPase
MGSCLKDFCTLLSVCHTAMVEKDPKDAKGELKYSASSPDELALVLGAKELGYVFMEKSATQIVMQIDKTRTEQYEVFAEFPFDSTRKRMSLLLKTQNKYFLMCKGADSIMMPRIKIDVMTQKKVEDDLYKFACDGLRTLVFAKKELSAKEFQDFMDSYTKMKTSVDSNKEKKLNEMFDTMEKGLMYVGSSAIEDKLQEGVADTISRIMKANIRVWVLTGDKQETAIEIGKSCKLI